MQKKLIAVAVAGALAGPAVAFAQASTVQIGGSLNLVYLPSHNPRSTDAKKGDILALSEPNMFIQGEEKLGGGLSAWFRCETTFDVVGGVATETGFCTRNSGVGFKGNFGNIFAGNWDAPSKDIFNAVRGWFGGTASFLGVTGNLILNGAASGLSNPPPFSAGGTAIATGTTSASFFRRQSNSWSYHSPRWNGFEVRGMFSAQNENTAIPASQGVKPRMYSLSAQYTGGPLWVGVGYENHKDYNPGGVAFGTTATTYSGGRDHAWMLGARYRFANVFTLSAIYTDMDYKVTNTTDLEAKGWAIYADYNLPGPHAIRAHYGRVGDTKGTSTTRVGNLVANAGAGGTGGKTYALAYTYSFSKRTEASLMYRHVKNEANTSRFGIGYEATTLGGKQDAIGLNIRHRF